MEDYKIQAKKFMQLSEIIGGDAFRAAETMKTDAANLVSDAKDSLFKIFFLNKDASHRSIYDDENGGRFIERNPRKYDDYVLGLKEYYSEITNEIENATNILEMLRDVVDETLDQLDTIQDALDRL